MRILAVALDYDGTIATADVLDTDVRQAIATLRAVGIIVLIVTGRILSELRAVAGDLHFADAVVAENGSVLHFTSSGYTRLLAPPTPCELISALKAASVEHTVGQCLLDLSAGDAETALSLVQRLELPLALSFNRNRLMILPQAVSKATGLREALKILRLSSHNAIGIGDAENDHELIREVEFGIAVQWGSEALKQAADFVLEGHGPPAVAIYLQAVAHLPTIPAPARPRRKLSLGYTDAGEEFCLEARERTILVCGDAKSGKSWVTGLLCEQLILYGYSLFIVDPEGDYTSLETLPGVTVFGGADPLPRPRDILRSLRHADTSIVVDLSHTSHEEKVSYVHALLPGLALLRHHTGLPHRVVLDEAHYFLGDHQVNEQLDLAEGSYMLVSYRPSWIPPKALNAADAIIVTRESSPVELAQVGKLCGESYSVEWEQELGSLTMSEAAVLPITAEAHGQLSRVHLSPRLTPHIRHAAKYVDIPVPRKDEFVFSQRGLVSGLRARTLREFIETLSKIDPEAISAHVGRHDFSRWIGDVFGDYPLAKTIFGIESQYPACGVATCTLEVRDAIRSRYDLIDPLAQLKEAS